MSALVIDIGAAYFSYQQLVAATDAAALAGGAAITAGNAYAAATQYSAASGDLNNHPNLQSVSETAQLKCLTATGLPPCGVYGGQPSANAIAVTEKANVSTVFAKIFGVNSIPLQVTATASARGGVAVPYNVMMVLDTTSSMGQGTDTGCTSNPKTAVSPEQCAQYGVQTLLSELDPCPTNLASCGTATNGVYANSVDEVGLMAFPGLCSTALSSGACPQASTVTSAAGPTASHDSTCPTSNPSITSYNNDPAYLILPLQSDYRTSDATTALNTAAGLVIAAGASGKSNCAGVQTPGGEGTFYAGAITAAQSYLLANSRPKVQNVMILLSDGNASASSAQMAGKATTYSATAQCQQAVNAANAAKNNGILIYSVSYGSETSGCSAGDTLTPCGTMSGISSLPLSQYFFSVPQTVGGKVTTVCSGAVGITQLNQVFPTIAGDLQGSRLLPNSVF
jgi:hypothetical protein